MKRLITALFLFIATTTLAEGEGGMTQPYVALQPEFIVNYGTGGTKVRYLKAAISLRVADTTAEAEVNHHSDAIRHEIILALSRQSTNDILDPEGKARLRKDIVAAIQAVMKEETGMKMVNDLLFTEWVVQR